MRTCSTATARVLLPDPLSPVNQTVAPVCLRRAARSSRVTVPGWYSTSPGLISDAISHRARTFGPGTGSVRRRRRLTRRGGWFVRARGVSDGTTRTRRVTQTQSPPPAFSPPLEGEGRGGGTDHPGTPDHP